MPLLALSFNAGGGLSPRAFVIIIMDGMAVVYVAGYLIEERRRWPIITASPRGKCSK